MRSADQDLDLDTVRKEPGGRSLPSAGGSGSAAVSTGAAASSSRGATTTVFSFRPTSDDGGHVGNVCVCSPGMECV